MQKSSQDPLQECAGKYTVYSNMWGVNWCHAELQGLTFTPANACVFQLWRVTQTLAD